MSRRVYLLGVGLALVALALAFTDWALSLQPGVTEANIKRLRKGMTLGEVEAVLGGPGEPLNEDEDGHPLGPWVWRGPDAHVMVIINSGRLSQILWSQPEQARPGFLARLRAWLGW
jgi:hypothetical protein